VAAHESFPNKSTCGRDGRSCSAESASSLRPIFGIHLEEADPTTEYHMEALVNVTARTRLMLIIGKREARICSCGRARDGVRADLLAHTPVVVDQTTQ